MLVGHSLVSIHVLLGGFFLLLVQFGKIGLMGLVQLLQNLD